MSVLSGNNPRAAGKPTVLRPCLVCGRMMPSTVSHRIHERCRLLRAKSPRVWGVDPDAAAFRGAHRE